MQLERLRSSCPLKHRAMVAHAWYELRAFCRFDGLKPCDPEKPYFSHEENFSKMKSGCSGSKQRNSVAVLDPSTSDRFSRAETAVERRMYRALALLAAMRAQCPGNLLLGPKKSR
jgi:hypothetical protein